jgi:hypothetical protein
MAGLAPYATILVGEEEIDWSNNVGGNNAPDIPIVDAGAYFTGTDVEAALQELGSGAAIPDLYLKKDGSEDLTSDWTIATNSIILTAGTLTANKLVQTNGTLGWEFTVDNDLGQDAPTINIETGSGGAFAIKANATASGMYFINSDFSNWAILGLDGDGKNTVGGFAATKIIPHAFSGGATHHLELSVISNILNLDFVGGNTPVLKSASGTFNFDDDNITTTGIITGTNTNWDAAFSHVSADGSSHSYINQSVTTSASPTFANLTVTNDITMSNNDWIGLGGGAGRIVFVDAAPNRIDVLGGIFRATDTGAHRLGPITFTNGAIASVTTLTATGAISGRTNSNFGDGGTTNYSQFEADGTLKFNGNATVWDDLRIVPGAFTFLGVGDPTLSAWQPAGSGATFRVYKFQKDNEAFASCQMPHGYKEGSDLYFHLHWTPADRGNEESGNTVGWKVDYTIANTDGTFPSSSTADLSDTCSGTDDEHELTSSVQVSGTGLTLSHIIMLRIYRSDTGTDDTWVGTTAAQSPAILEFDIHFEKDTVGSRQELVK